MTTPANPYVYETLLKIRQTMTPDNTCRGAEFAGRKYSFHQHILLACEDPENSTTGNKLYLACLKAIAKAGNSHQPLAYLMKLSHENNLSFDRCLAVLDKAIFEAGPDSIPKKWKVTRILTQVVEAKTAELAQQQIRLKKFQSQTTIEEIQAEL